jgi:hypothetical protein
MLVLSRSTLLGCVVAGLLLIGCAPATVRNVSDAPVKTNKHPVTMEEVDAAIKRAGTGLGWAMLDDGPGKITGTLRLRTHVAVVVVTYDTAKYSIQYKDSTNLNYDPKKNTIHKNYNGWIQNLDNAIQRELSAIT